MTAYNEERKYLSLLIGCSSSKRNYLRITSKKKNSRSHLHQLPKITLLPVCSFSSGCISNNCNKKNTLLRSHTCSALCLTYVIFDEFEARATIAKLCTNKAHVPKITTVFPPFLKLCTPHFTHLSF